MKEGGHRSPGAGDMACSGVPCSNSKRQVGGGDMHSSVLLSNRSAAFRAPGRPAFCNPLPRTLLRHHTYKHNQLKLNNVGSRAHGSATTVAMDGRLTKPVCRTT